MDDDGAEEFGLLGLHDPPATTSLRPRSIASGRPLLLVCDHASRVVPRKLKDLGLDESLLLRHIGWDIGAAAVTHQLAERLQAWAVLTGYSRLVIDCNRDPGTPSSIPEISDGIAIPGNRGLDEAQRAQREHACFDPYHAAIERALAVLSGGEAAPVIVSIHSFTPVMDGFVRPWHVGLLWDRDPRLAHPLIAALSADSTLVVGDNEPYSARDPEGLTLRRHAEGVGLAHVLIELRQDLIDTPAGAAAWAGRLEAALRPILDDPAVYRRERFG